MKKQHLSKKYFLKGIYGVDTFKEITELFRADYIAVKDTDKEKALNLFQKYVLAITFRSTPNSIRASLAILRKVIREEGGRYEEETIYSFYFYNLYPFISAERAKKERELINGIKSPFNDHEDGLKPLYEYVDNEFISCILTGVEPIIKKSFKREITLKEAWERVILHYEKKVPNFETLIFKSVTVQDKIIFLNFDYKN